MSSSIVFITFYLFLVYYSESLDCNGRQLNYQNYTIQPIIISHFDATSHAKVASFINDEKKSRLGEVANINGLRRIFEVEAAHMPDAIVISSSLTPSDYNNWDARLSQWGGEFYTQTVVPFIRHPPNFLKTSIVTVSSLTDASTMVKADEAGRKGDGTNSEMKVVQWPVVITDKGPNKNADGNFHDFASTYPHVSLITLNNAEAANEWKSKAAAARTPPLSPTAPAGQLRVFNIQDLSNIENDVFQVPFLKELLQEINAVLCSTIISTTLEGAEVKSAGAAGLAIYAGVGAVLFVLVAVGAAPYFLFCRFGGAGKMAKGLWVGEDGVWHAEDEEGGEQTMTPIVIGRRAEEKGLTSDKADETDPPHHSVEVSPTQWFPLK